MQVIIPRVEIQRQSRHPLQLRWSTKNLKLLGRIPDAQLARKFGISIDAVQGERRRRGIEPYRPRRADIQWTRGMMQLLGTDIDRNIAVKLSLPTYAVRHKRQRMNISPFSGAVEQVHPNAFLWTKAKIALLGTDCDRKIAARLRTSLGVVTRQRVRLGIRSFYRQRRILWSKEMKAILGKVTDREVARKYRMSKASVARARRAFGIRRCIENRPVKRTRDLKNILHLPIRAICNHYGLSSETVARLRLEFGVKPLRRWPERSQG